MSFTPISSVFFSRLHSIFVNINVQITTVRLDSSSSDYYNYLNSLLSISANAWAALYQYRITDSVLHILQRHVQRKQTTVYSIYPRQMQRTCIQIGTWTGHRSPL